jgi:hypothetical protein
LLEPFLSADRGPSSTVTDTAHALLNLTRATSHGGCDVTVIAICAADTVVRDPSMVAYNRCFFQSVGWSGAENVALVKLWAFTRLPLHAAHVAELVTADTSCLVRTFV